MSRKSDYYYQSFKENYLTDFPFIRKSNRGKNYAFCTTCRSDFCIAHGGRTDITAHASRQKHKENTIAAEKSQKLDCLFQQKTNVEKSVINAECLFTAFILEHNLPITCADHAGQLFKNMFPDSKIAKTYACARTKTSNIIKEIALSKGLALNETLRNSPYSVAVDGSNDTDSKLYPIVVTYFNTNLSKIDCSLLCMPCLESNATGLNIGNLILNNLEALQIPIANCLTLSCDNAPVMIGEKSGVISVLKKANENICALGCCCHLINLAAEKGSSCLPFKIDEILVDIYFYLEKSSNRKERLKELQNLHDSDVRKILKHVCTRWLSVNVCLTRLMEQWLPVTIFFKEECNKQKNKNSLSFYKIPKKLKKESDAKTAKDMPNTQSSCSSISKSKVATKRKANKSTKSDDKWCFLAREERIFYFLSSDFNKALCCFLLNIVAVFDKTNQFLQSQSPQIHVLRTVLLDLMKDVLIRFVKPEVLKQCLSYLDVDYHKLSNQKNDCDLIIGNTASTILETLLDKDVSSFYITVRKYFCTVCDYMRLKFPFNNEIIINAEVANLVKISSSSFSKLRYFLDKYPCILNEKLTLTKSAAIDQIQEEFCALQIERELIDSVKSERIDQQWFLIGQVKNELGQKKFQMVSNVMLSILIFPHSNAECERIFSQVKKTRTQFRSSMSDTMLEKILMAKDSDKKCYESCFDDAFLKKAKTCTYESFK